MFVKMGIIMILLWRELNGLFVEMGKYPQMFDKGVNLDECGLKLVSQTYIISFSKECYFKDYPNVTAVIQMTEQMPDGSQLVSSRIWKGTQVENEWISPWTLRIVINGNIECTGVLVTFEWFMTAAHCVDSMTKSGMVFTGSNKMNHIEERAVNMNKRFKHPYYDDPSLLTNDTIKQSSIKTAHDVALVKLDKNFTKHLNDGTHYLINTICLPKEGEVNVNEEYAIMTGWGLIKQDPQTLPQKLQMARVKLDALSSNVCPLKRLVLCSFQNDLIPKGCRGDSGGPLVQMTGTSRAILIGTYKGDKPLPPNTHCQESTSQRAYWVPTMKIIPWILQTIRDN